MEKLTKQEKWQEIADFFKTEDFVKLLSTSTKDIENKVYKKNETSIKELQDLINIKNITNCLLLKLMTKKDIDKLDKKWLENNYEPTTRYKKRDA